MPPSLHKPLSVQLTDEQVRWLENYQQHGTISRSAALRMALDRLMRLEASALAAQPKLPRSRA
jgi:hypothetical protein